MASASAYNDLVLETPITTTESQPTLSASEVPPCIMSHERECREREEKEKSAKLLNDLNAENPELARFNELYVKYREIQEPLLRMEYLKDVSREDIASLREIYLRRWVQINSFYSSHVMTLNQFLYDE